MGQCYRAACTNLPLKQGHYTAVGAQHIAEANGGKLGLSLLLQRLDNDFRHALGGTHHIGGVHGLVGGDHHKALRTVFHGALGYIVGAEYIVLHGLLRAVLHQRHVLVSGSMDHDFRLELVKDTVQRFWIPDGAYTKLHRVLDDFTVLLL